MFKLSYSSTRTITCVHLSVCPWYLKGLLFSYQSDILLVVSIPRKKRKYLPYLYLELNQIQKSLVRNQIKIIFLSPKSRHHDSEIVGK